MEVYRLRDVLPVLRCVGVGVGAAAVMRAARHDFRGAVIGPLGCRCRVGGTVALRVPDAWGVSGDPAEDIDDPFGEPAAEWRGMALQLEPLVAAVARGIR